MREYRHLGWDPTPGSPPAIAALHVRLDAAATALGTSYRLVDVLVRDSTHWRGEAGDAFRTALTGDLPRSLRNAHRSLTKAAQQLGRWHDDLVEYQSTAARYDAEAREDLTALTRAQSHEHQLRTTPNTPTWQLRAAHDAVTEARESLESIRGLARELEEAHKTQATRIANSLNAATLHLAPEEPGVLDQFLEWMDDNLGDALGLLSASLGLVAVFSTAPVAVPLLFAAAGLSAAALASHATDPEHQSALAAGFAEGRFDARFWSSAITLCGDSLGALPGLGAVAQGAKGMAVATRSGAAAQSSVSAGLRSGLDALWTESAAGMRDGMSAPKPVLDWVVRRTSPSVEVPLQTVVAGSGVATSVVGLTPAGDSAEAQSTGAGVDAARLITSDIPGAGVTAAQTWSQIRR